MCRRGFLIGVFGDLNTGAERLAPGSINGVMGHREVLLHLQVNQRSAGRASHENGSRRAV
jgi:hypothetical protein